MVELVMNVCVCACTQTHIYINIYMLCINTNRVYSFKTIRKGKKEKSIKSKEGNRDKDITKKDFSKKSKAFTIVTPVNGIYFLLKYRIHRSK